MRQGLLPSWPKSNPRIHKIVNLRIPDLPQNGVLTHFDFDYWANRRRRHAERFQNEYQARHERGLSTQ